MKGVSAAPGGGRQGLPRRRADHRRPPNHRHRGADPRRRWRAQAAQWQAVTHLSPHTGNGTKDYLGASLILELLMSHMPDATVIPTLVEEVPSIENGGLSEDLKTVTYKIKQASPGVTASPSRRGTCSSPGSGS